MTKNTMNKKIITVIVGTAIAIVLGLLTMFKVVPDIAMNDQLNAAIDYYLINEGEEITDANHKIINGDYVNLDYKGTIDGKEFDGGATEGYVLHVGSKTFIDGFEEQLVGHKKNDKFDINVTFPKNYSAKTLAGKKAVFNVKINKIMHKAKLTDNYVKNLHLDGVTDVKSFKKYIREAIEQQKRQQQSFGNNNQQ